MSEENERIPELLEKFLDAETVAEKLRILEESEELPDERTMGNIEASLDLVGKDGATIEQRIDYVEYYLRTRGHFELGSGRLR